MDLKLKPPESTAGKVSTLDVVMNNSFKNFMAR